MNRRSSPLERTYPLDPDREATSRYLEELGTTITPHPEIEDAFIRSVVRYSVKMGISSDGWRSIGVPSRVLRAAGME